MNIYEMSSLVKEIKDEVYKLMDIRMQQSIVGAGTIKRLVFDGEERPDLVGMIGLSFITGVVAIQTADGGRWFFSGGRCSVEFEAIKHENGEVENE